MLIVYNGVSMGLITRAIKDLCEKAGGELVEEHGLVKCRLKSGKISILYNREARQYKIAINDVEKEISDKVPPLAVGIMEYTGNKLEDVYELRSADFARIIIDDVDEITAMGLPYIDAITIYRREKH